MKNSDNSDNEKYLYSGYGITFDSTGLGSFDNGFTRNVVIFVVDDSSSSHADNCKTNFLVLGEGPTCEVPTFNKANTKFCLSFHNNSDCLLMEKKSLI